MMSAKRCIDEGMLVVIVFRNREVAEQPHGVILGGDLRRGIQGALFSAQIRGAGFGGDPALYIMPWEHW